MEFANREACINHYQDQFPRLPRYMIQMALDYDLNQGGSSNEKPLTNKEKRKQKQAKKAQPPVTREFEEQLKSKLENGEFLEFECAKVVKGEDYVMPPMMQGAVNVDGAEYAKLQEQKQSDAKLKLCDAQQNDAKQNDEMSEIKM
jgi:hypothetical protein